MNIKEAAIQIENAVRVYFAKDAFGNYRLAPEKQRPIFLVGAPGIGKTAIMEQLADKLSIGLISYSMTHHTRQSALGLPFITKKNYGSDEYSVSEYTMSEIIASVYEYMEHTGVEEGILFLDEINCVSETLTPAMLQFLQYKVFGTHKLPRGWVVVTAGNPPEYNRSVREFDIATLDRLKRIDVEPDYSVWREYALVRGVHPSVLFYLDNKSDDFYRIETSAGSKSYVTARGWEDLSQMLVLYEEQNIPVTLELTSQYLQNKRIAADFTDSYSLYAKFNDLFAPSAILKGNYNEEAVKLASECSAEERFSITGGLLSAVISDISSKMTAYTAAAEAMKEIRENEIPTDGASEALKELALKKKSALRAKSQLGAVSFENEKEEQAVISVLEQIAENAQEKDLKTAVSRLGEKTKTEMSDASEKLKNALIFTEKAFGGGREMTLFTSGVSENRSASKFLRVYGCDEFFKYAFMNRESQDEIEKQLSALTLDLPD